MQWIQDNWAALVGIQQALFVLLSLICQLAGWTSASKFFGTYSTLDLGRLTRNAQAKSAVVNGMLLMMVALAASGCNGTLHQQIEKALVFEQQVHTYQQQLLIVAQASIAMLPADKQADALRVLGDANAKLTLALDAKDAALQAALDASDSSINVNQLIADIVGAVQAVIAVVNSFGANQQHTQALGTALVSAQTRAMVK